jgi:hypothetical protein
MSDYPIRSTLEALRDFAPEIYGKRGVSREVCVKQADGISQN